MFGLIAILLFQFFFPGIYFRAVLYDKDFYRILFNFKNDAIVAYAKFPISLERAPKRLAVKIWICGKTLLNSATYSISPQSRDFGDIASDDFGVIDDGKHKSGFYHAFLCVM